MNTLLCSALLSSFQEGGKNPQTIFVCLLWYYDCAFSTNRLEDQPALKRCSRPATITRFPAILLLAIEVGTAWNFSAPEIRNEILGGICTVCMHQLFGLHLGSVVHFHKN